MPLHPIVIGVLLEALEARERFLCTQKIITTEEHSHYQKNKRAPWQPGTKPANFENKKKQGRAEQLKIIKRPALTM